MRTIGSVESMNGKINKIFRIHPNIFKFLDCLKHFEAGKFFEMENSNLPGESPPRKNKDVERQEKYCHFYNLLERKNISVDVFLESMANRKMLPPQCNIFCVFC